jgi:hypothetical protein
MKKTLSLYMLLVASIHGYSQVIYYGYDNAGNRTKRSINVIPLKSTAENADDEKADQEISEPTDENIITVYPNPVKEFLMIEIKGLSAEQEASIYMYGITGELITRIETHEVLTTVSFAELARGTYIMLIHYGKDRREWKIIRE